MNTQQIQLNVALNFEQLIEVVRQLSTKEKIILKGVLHEIDTDEDYEIPEAHKNIVRKRMKASEANPSRMLNWDEVKHKIKL